MNPNPALASARQTQTVNVSNTATGPTGYVEGLAASIGSNFIGTATGTGFGNAAAGHQRRIGRGPVGHCSAGNNSGTVNVQLAVQRHHQHRQQRAGQPRTWARRRPSPSPAPAGAWRKADTVTSVAFGNVHVGDTVTRILTISNTGGPTAFTERLNASFGAASDTRITTSGSVSPGWLLAPATTPAWWSA